ncbi:hypothetical protein GCM10027277_31500 [Pseudoduganella ginsengisoli]|uniref:Glycosyltransferase n=1 Tax=Pseudoduganella ginsengisoli TaxID=1462440 RepID=A0A6L6PZJ2_9BURK|nr:glycosyltransferase [Pseudoduganella ginsengisoli]MTW02561.1 glycosyltransferase [Pseudoduganella ginsengisoli]
MLSPFARRLFSLASPAFSDGRLTILLFHKIPALADPLTPDELNLTHFCEMLDFLSEHMHVMPLSEAVTQLPRGKLPKRSVALTFDDGYVDWLDHVAPALRERQMTGTFFVTTEQLAGPSLWHERIVAAVRALPDQGVTLPYGFGGFNDLRTENRRQALVTELQARLKYASVVDRMAALAQLEAQATVPLQLPPHFDADAVRALHSQGFEIGAHTVGHPILSECTAEQAMAEIGGCKEQLEAIIRAKVNLFAYPNGRPQKDYREEHVKMVKACGYQAAVATSPGAATADADLFQLPRFTPWRTSPERLAYQLVRNARVRGVTVPVSGSAKAENSNDVRCLLIASTFPPIHGGSAVVYENLCRQMPEGSIRVLTAHTNYLTNKEIPGWREHDAKATYPIDRVPLLRPLMQPPPRNLAVSVYRLLVKDLPLYASNLITAAWLAKRHRINVVCVGELVTGSWLGIALKKLFGCKLVIYVHGEEITQATGGRLHGNSRKKYLDAADKVVAVSSFTCDALTHKMQLQPESIALIQNGVDTGRFTPGPVPADLVEKHRLHGKKVVLTVGRLVPRKGVDMALQAMMRIVRQRQDIHYLVVGDGELREQLKHTIATEKLGDSVTLVGQISDADLVRYLRLCDLFIMPNRTMPDGDTEGFGLVFREANACGKPVIGGRAGGVVEAVLDRETGYLVDGTDAEDIARAVVTILDDPALRNRLSENGLRVALQNNTAMVARQFLRTCERLLNHNVV